ncbi:MAG: PEP-CTERM sorting domain-containing protein [Planctomycetes bacterium]|nr:PEP-CTERM sorting domain-containing protein [Planctomycetota bacterium]
MFRWTRAFIAIAGFSFASAAQAGEVLTFLNDYEGFLEAAGDVQTIDFETLPDGSPSYAGADITPDFNYTSQGVAFSSPFPTLEIRGNETFGYGLAADCYPFCDHTWIVGDLVIPAFAVGTFIPSAGTLSIFDAKGELLASENYGAVDDVFIGFLSRTPIESATVEKTGDHAFADSFHFSPVPEPGAVSLFGLGLVVLFGRRRAG